MTVPLRRRDRRRAPERRVLGGKEVEARGRRTRRDEGDGGSDGVVLDLTMVGDGIMSAVYTVPVTVGSNNQSFKLQVDTGSSDLWIASKSCSTQSCSANKPRLYDPSTSSVDTHVPFDIQYLSGQVEGPIVWDRFSLGGYVIENQALAAASSVVNESLTGDYSGILGLALPLNSVIAGDIPPVTNDQPDGATVISNLFGADHAPSQLFHSILLARPNMDRIPSMLAIGRHPSNDYLPEGLTIEPSNIAYSSVIAERDGTHFWKTELRAITVYVNGTARKVDIGRSVTGSVFPQAVLDTGVPYMISTPTIANAVWGALGISPASDGQYYVPCTTPLNMTITLDNRTEIPLHPLDLSAVPGNGGSSCIGLLQQSSALTNAAGFGDIILGVPFLRNVYTVMAYETANSQGVVGDGARRMKRQTIAPRLGLLNLTDPTTALEEFNTVRVLNQPLKGNNKQTGSSGDGISVGLKVLFGLIGFVVLCGALFGARWLFMRRRNRRMGATPSDGLNDKETYAMAAYHLAPFRSHSYVPSEDTQRTLADPTARLDKKYDTLHKHSESVGDEEVGFRRSKKIEDGELERPKMGEEGWEPHHSWIDSYSEYQPPLLGEWRPPEHERTHERSYSTASVQSAHAPSSPLLATHHTLTPIPLEQDIDEFGGLDVDSMLGIGTAAGRRGSIQATDLDATLTNETRHLHSASADSESSDSSSALARPQLARPRPRPGRTPSGPRTSSTMSRVINAGDIT